MGVQSAAGKWGKLYNASVTVNAVDLSSFVRSVSVRGVKADLDISAMGDVANVHLDGIEDSYIEVEFWQSYYTAEVDKTLYTLWKNGTTFAVAVKPDSAAAGAGNPSFTLNAARLLEYAGLEGAHGDALSAGTVRFVNAKTGSTGGIVQAYA